MSLSSRVSTKQLAASVRVIVRVKVRVCTKQLAASTCERALERTPISSVSERRPSCVPSSSAFARPTW